MLLVVPGACRSPRQSPDLVLAEAQRHFDRGEIEVGLALLETELARTPADERETRARIHEGLAHGETRRIDPEAALVHAERATELAPERAWAWYAKGVALHTIGDYPAAVGAFDESLRLDPADVKALEWRAAAQALRGEHEDAVRDLTRALDELARADDARVAHWRVARGSLRDELLRLRADSLEELGRYDAAQKDRDPL